MATIQAPEKGPKNEPPHCAPMMAKWAMLDSCTQSRSSLGKASRTAVNSVHLILEALVTPHALSLSLGLRMLPEG